MAEIEKELRHYLDGDVEPRAALEWSRETSAAMVDLKFCDLLGTWQHVTLPVGSFDESAFDEGLGFDGSSIRGWQGIEESDMLLMPDAVDGDPRPVHRGADALARLRDRGAGDARAVREGSAPRREARRGLPPRLRHRRHVLRRPRVRVLRLRRGVVHERPERGALQGRLVGRPLELRRRRPRLHDPREAGLLPAGAARHAERPAHAHGADARAARHSVRVPPSRGRVGRAVRDRPALPEPDAHGGSGAALQVRRQERRARRRQVGDVHAEADLRRQRLGHALPPVAVEGGHAALRRQVRPRGAVAARSRLRRRPARARAGAARVLCADDELVPPARAGLRGAGQSRVLVAQPQCVHPHPDVQRVAEGEADRVPLPRPDCESVPRVRGDADGGPRRDRARASTRASRPTSTSSRTTAASRRCPARSPRRSTRSRRITRSSRRAACSART